MAEVTIEEQMREILKSRYPQAGRKLQRQINAHPVLGPALKEGGKPQKGKRKDPSATPGEGTPEAALFLEGACTTPLALIECKREGNLKGAVADIRHYLKHVEKSHVIVPLGIAYAGEGHFKILRFVDGKFFECKRANGTQFEDFPSWEELQALADTQDGILHEPMSSVDEDTLGQFFVMVNKVMQNKHVQTGLERVILFTSFLVACKEESFRETVSKPGKKTPTQLAAEIRSTVQSLIEESAAKAVDDSIERDLMKFIGFVKGRLDQETAKDALAQVIKVTIPAFCAKHRVHIKDFLNGLNESAFKVVDVYEVFHTYSPANDLGQYFTPRHMVRAMIRLVEALRGRVLDVDDIVYDNACGVGGFLVGALERAADGRHGDEKIAAKLKMGRNLIGCEPTREIAHIARVNLWMHGDGTSGIYEEKGSLERSYAANSSKSKPGDVNLDTSCPEAHPLSQVLARNTEGKAPTIALLNPPFPEDKKAYQSFEFIEHVVRSLANDGWVAAIVPSTTVISEDKAHVAFRSRVLKYAQLEAVITLPPDLFEPGASVNTYIIVLRKQTGGHQLRNPVLFARCLTDGFEMSKSINRRVGPRNDAERVSRAWNDDVRVGGRVAELLSTWLPEHLDKGTSHSELAASKRLSKSDKETGADWAAERFIDKTMDDDEVVKTANRIYAEMQCFELMKEVGGAW